MGQQKLKQLIEAIVKKEIRLFEKAIGVGSSSNLCLMVSDTLFETGTEVAFVLYDGQAALEEIKDSGYTGGVINNRLDFKKAIIGILTAQEQTGGQAFGTRKITSAAAEKGYGPAIYDIALSYFYEQGLTPDRGSVSPEAKKVWDFYHTKRQDVTSRPLDNIKRPRTPTPEDDSRFHNPESPDNSLNRAYWIKQPVDYSRLIQNHKSFMKEAIELMIDNHEEGVFNLSDSQQKVWADKYGLKPELSTEEASGALEFEITDQANGYFSERY